MSNGSKLTHVRPGDPLEISAGTFNAMVDAAKAHQGGRHGVGRTTRPDLRQSNMVLVRNDSGFDLDRYNVLGLSGVLFDPTAYPTSFQREIAVTGVIPVPGTHDDNFVVLQEPIKDGDLGLAMVAGVSIVKVYVVSSEANSIFSYAKIQAAAASLEKAPSGPVKIIYIEAGTGNKWALVSFGQVKPVTWAKATDDWTNVAGNASYVDAYPCDDGSGTTVDTTTAVKVWLPRNGLQKDPNIREDAIFPIAPTSDGNYVCVGEYLDEEIGSIKIWHSTTVPAGWQLAAGFGGRFLVGYDSTDSDHDAVGETGGASTHTHANHDNHSDHADHPNHTDHASHGWDSARQLEEAATTGFDRITDTTHDAHSSHGSHGAHSAHSAHDTVSNKPEYKTVVIIERVN